MPGEPKKWWEVVALLLGTGGGIKVAIDVTNWLFLTRPKLAGSIEFLRSRVEHVDKLASEHSGCIVADLFVVNRNADPTTVFKWELEVKTTDGQTHHLSPVNRPQYWEEFREDSRPPETEAFNLRAVFQRNIGVRGWMYFPWNIFNGEVAEATLIATDARGKRHRIKKA